MDVLHAGRGLVVVVLLEVDDGFGAHLGEGGEAFLRGSGAAPDIGGDEAEVADAWDAGGERVLGSVGGGDDHGGRGGGVAGGATGGEEEGADVEDGHGMAWFHVVDVNLRGEILRCEMQVGGLGWDALGKPRG